jgi:hypothetical protein
MIAMGFLSKVLGFVAALGVFALGVWAFIKGVEKDPAVVGTVITAVAGVAIVVYQRRREKLQELERSHRLQMGPLYTQLVEAMKDWEGFAKKPQSEQEAFFKDLSTKLILFGATPVVKAWVSWQRSVASDAAPPQGLIDLEKVLLAIRADLGHDNSELKRGDVLRLFVNEEDTDEDRAFWQAIRSSR